MRKKTARKSLIIMLAIVITIAMMPNTVFAAPEQSYAKEVGTSFSMKYDRVDSIDTKSGRYIFEEFGVDPASIAFGKDLNETIRTFPDADRTTYGIKVRGTAYGDLAGFIFEQRIADIYHIKTNQGGYLKVDGGVLVTTTDHKYATEWQIAKHGDYWYVQKGDGSNTYLAMDIDGRLIAVNGWSNAGAFSILKRVPDFDTKGALTWSYGDNGTTYDYGFQPLSEEDIRIGHTNAAYTCHHDPSGVAFSPVPNSAYTKVVNFNNGNSGVKNSVYVPSEGHRTARYEFQLQDKLDGSSRYVTFDVPINPHVWDYNTLYDRVAPTCTTQGSYKVRCYHYAPWTDTAADKNQNICQGINSTVFPINVDPNAHDWSSWSQFDGIRHKSTCVHDGRHERLEEHTFNKTVVPPTHTSEGYTTNFCTTCNYESVTDHTPIVPHTYTPWKHNPVGADRHYTHTRTCTVCTGYSETKDCQVAAFLPTWSCLETRDMTSKCNDCDYSITYPVKGHHNRGLREPTCHTKRVCTACGQEHGSFDPYNHDGDTEVRGKIDPTYTAVGFTGDTYCLGCNAKTISGSEIPKTADASAPTGEIKVNNNSFKEFVNDITFGLFFKEIVDVAITGADTESGIKSIEYQKVQNQADYHADGTWTPYSAFSVAPGEKFIVYAKITNTQDMTTIINSDGIVAYTDSTVSSTSTEFEKNPGNQKDVVVTMSLNNNVFEGIANGTNVLVKDKDYSIAGNDLTLKKEYLATLDYGVQTFKFTFSPVGVAGSTVSSAEFSITVVDIAHIHVFDTNFTVDNAANCAHAGEMSRHCKDFATCKGRTEVISTPSLPHDFDKSVPISDGTHHWYKCKDCSELSPKTTHSGGTATCHSKAICTECKTEYGSLNPDNHDFDKSAPISDGTHHWYKCKDCNELSPKTTHSGGTATCHSKAICTECKTEYGSLNPDNHDFDKSAPISDGTHYWYKCKNCSELSPKTAHSGGGGVIPTPDPTAPIQPKEQTITNADGTKTTVLLFDGTKSGTPAKGEALLSAEALAKIAAVKGAGAVVATSTSIVQFDQKALQAITGGQTKGNIKVIAEIVNPDTLTPEQKALLGDNALIIDLSVENENGKVTDFNGGTATVVINIPAGVDPNTLGAVYIKTNGKLEKVEGKVVMVNGVATFQFVTNHFSKFAVLDKATIDKAIATQEAMAKDKLVKGVKATKLTAIKAVAKKSNVTVTWKKSKGYKVDGYQIWKSSKKTTGYKMMAKRTGQKYKNTYGLKAGKTYYYKVRGFREIDGKIVYTKWAQAKAVAK